MRHFVGSAYGSLDSFQIAEAAVQLPREGELRLRIDATALGFVDGLMALGRYQIRPPLPYVPGGEIAGAVDAVGPAVDGFTVGDRVATWQLGGGLAEYVIVRSQDVFRIPTQLASATAAAMLVDYQTAHYAIFERGQLRAGETVLILGAAGGVGSAALQLAVRAGAYVIAAASNGRKRDRAVQLGAKSAIDSSAPDLRACLREAAPDGTVDLIVDPVGGDLFEPMFRSLAKEGRHLVIGFAAGRIPSLPINLALLKSASLVGVELRHFLQSHPAKAAMARMQLFEDVVCGGLNGPVIIPFPLDHARDALETAMSRDKLGKVVILTDKAEGTKADK